MKKTLLILLIAILTVACDNKPKEAVRVKEIKKEFIVKIKFKTNKEDSFKFVFNNIEIDEFQKKNIQIIEQVVPNSNYETTTANFGENRSNRFSISLGNKQVKEVDIEYINIQYGKNKLNIKSNELKKHFTFNKFVTQDTTTNKLITKKVDGKYNPVITLKRKTLQNVFK